MNIDFKAKKIFFVFIFCSIMISCFLFTSVSHAASTDFITSSDFYVDNLNHYPNGDSIYNAKSGNWVGRSANPKYGEAQAAVKFDLSAIAGTVTVSDATLKIFVNDILGTPDLYKLYGSNNDAWLETATTIPSKDTLLNTLNGAIAKNQWITVNVTSFVQSKMSTDKITSFVLTGNTTAGKAFNFNSKESPDNKPTLSVTYTVQSNNANLNGLTLSSGALSPVFSSAITSYSASVPNSTASVGITPTVADSTATVKVNSANATSGSPTSVTLSPGPNPIKVEVTAQDGTLKTYTVTVNRALSSNADLSSLTLSQGTLNPLFSSSTTSYSASVGNGVSSLDITPTVADSTATIKVNSANATSGSPTSITLSPGPNPINVEVTAQDGTVKTYTVTVTVIISDTTPPVTTAVYSSSPSTGWSLSDIQLTLSATDDSSGVKMTEYRVNGGVWNVYTSPIMLTQNGIYTYEFRSTDNAGNVEITQSIVLKIDKTAAVTKYHFDPIYAYDNTGKPYIKGYTTTLRASDNVYGSGVNTIQYRINGNTWIPYTSPFTVYAGVTHTVEYYSTDIAGNVESPINKMDFDRGTFTGAGKF